MLALLSAMACMLAIYYFWPAGSAILSKYGAWQQAGGLIRTGLVAGFAGGILSELSLVYVRDHGRWNSTHVENIVFRSILFFFSGMMVGEFYIYQAYWFGDGLSWRILLPKILVDQCVYTIIWSTPFYALTFRWQALRYSASRLWRELNWNFVEHRMLPVLVTNWMFWIPGVTLVYSMPLALQMPLNIFATAIWGILIAAVANDADGDTLQPLPLTGVPEIQAQPAE
jgi:hypothetical protein